MIAAKIVDSASGLGIPGLVVPDAGDLAARGYATPVGTNLFLNAGQVTNMNFTVARTNLPALSNPIRLSSTEFQCLLAAVAGQNYTFQAITNLNSSNWSDLLATNAPCDAVYLVDGEATNAQRFYRAIVAP